MSNWRYQAHCARKGCPRIMERHAVARTRGKAYCSIVCAELDAPPLPKFSYEDAYARGYAAAVKLKSEVPDAR